MTDFAEGDKVRTTRPIADIVPIGTRGTVVRIGDGDLSPFDYRVFFPEFPFYMRGEPEQPEWPVLSREIEKVE